MEGYRTYPATRARAPMTPIAPLTATLRPADDAAEVEVDLAVDELVAEPEWLVVVVILLEPDEPAVELAAEGVARGAVLVPAICD